MEAHDAAISSIASSVRKFYSSKTPFHIYHGSTNSNRMLRFERSQCVDTSGLSKILKIDTGKKTALVEPNISIGCLVRTTLRYGLVPPIVMAFPSITVGGGFSGVSGGSSSFRHGLFQETINWIEMILANGEIVTASRSVKPDLFCGSASSFGTLGVTTLLEVQLIEAKRFVELTYHPISGITEAQHKMKEAMNDHSIEYIDGIMFSHERGVICSGRSTNYVDHGVKTRRFTRRTDPWFYLHAEGLVESKSSPSIEVIPVVDYLFRYDRGTFWAASHTFTYFGLAFNCVTRFMLDYFMHTHVLFHGLHKSGLTEHHIVQNAAIPYHKAEEFMQYLHTSFKKYPVWLCPLRLSGKSTQSIHTCKTNRPLPDTMLNFGIWGPGPKVKEEFILWNRRFERKVCKAGGMKWLHALAYYTEEEFYAIYNRKLYNSLRAKYHASHLPSMYDKVTSSSEEEKRTVLRSWVRSLLALFWSIWPFAGLYCVYRALLGGPFTNSLQMEQAQEPRPTA